MKKIKAIANNKSKHLPAGKEYLLTEEMYKILSDKGYLILERKEKKVN